MDTIQIYIYLTRVFQVIQQLIKAVIMTGSSPQALQAVMVTQEEDPLLTPKVLIIRCHLAEQTTMISFQTLVPLSVIRKICYHPPRVLSLIWRLRVIQPRGSGCRIARHMLRVRISPGARADLRARELLKRRGANTVLNPKRRRKGPPTAAMLLLTAHLKLVDPTAVMAATKILLNTQIN